MCQCSASVDDDSQNTFFDNNFVAAVELDSTSGRMMTRGDAGGVAPEGSG